MAIYRRPSDAKRRARGVARAGRPALRGCFWRAWPLLLSVRHSAFLVHDSVFAVSSFAGVHAHALRVRVKDSPWRTWHRWGGFRARGRYLDIRHSLFMIRYSAFLVHDSIFAVSSFAGVHAHPLRERAWHLWGSSGSCGDARSSGDAILISGFSHASPGPHTADCAKSPLSRQSR